jgi:hypothetical protein
METARPDDLFQRLHRHAIAVSGEIPVDVVLEAATRPTTLDAPDVAELHAHRIHDDRSGAFQVFDRRHEHGHDLWIRRVTLVRLAQNADARPFEAVALQRLRIVRDGAPARCRRHRIIRILSGDHL